MLATQLYNLTVIILADAFLNITIANMGGIETIRMRSRADRNALRNSALAGTFGCGNVLGMTDSREKKKWLMYLAWIVLCVVVFWKPVSALFLLAEQDETARHPVATDRPCMLPQAAKVRNAFVQACDSQLLTHPPECPPIALEYDRL